MSIALERRRYMGASEEVTPYIYGDGNSYIDTGVAAYTDVAWEITMSDIEESGGQLLVASSNCRFIKWTAYEQLGLVMGSTYLIADHDGVQKFTAKYISSVFYIDGTQVGTISPPNMSNHYLILGGNYSGTYYITKGKVYGCKMWYNGTLIRDFVPALSNGEYGLYDQVNDTFYGSATSTPFSGGGYNYLITNYLPFFGERRAA